MKGMILLREKTYSGCIGGGDEKGWMTKLMVEWMTGVCDKTWVLF
jgi:hypothetical protein